MNKQENKRKSVGAVGILGSIRAYQKVLSPIFGKNCRYHPSCSHYTYEAVELHGAVKGSWLGVKRIGRCQPFYKGGFDPVPGSPDAAARESQGGTQ
jgi:putative membrane protein insertion efficiency factor